MWKVLTATLLLLLTTTQAQASPPRPGLCEGLTGDPLTRCLYSDLDDRLGGVKPTPLTRHG